MVFYNEFISARKQSAILKDLSAFFKDLVLYHHPIIITMLA